MALGSAPIAAFETATGAVDAFTITCASLGQRARMTARDHTYGERRADGPSRPTAWRVGCAGWSLGAQHAALFGEGDSHLARYATGLNAVEINSSFYRPHRRQTYEKWAASVPPDFRFSVKLPKAITHEAALRGVGDALSAFAEQVSGLGRRLGGLLVQLPPSHAFDARVADRFFAMLRRRLDVPVACEPRHASWFAPPVDRLWTRYAIARVAADPAPHPPAAEPGGAGAWCYWRWHGSPRMYYSAYDDARLDGLAQQVAECQRPRRVAWCIFDNTAHGHAVEDALRLQARLHGRP